MTIPRMTVLVVGATGSIGRLVVAEALRLGHTVRALVRDVAKARRVLGEVEAKVIVGDVTRPETLAAVAEGVDGSLHGQPRRGAHAGVTVEHPGDGLVGHPRQGSDVDDRGRAAGPVWRRHVNVPFDRFVTGCDAQVRAVEPKIANSRGHCL